VCGVFVCGVWCGCVCVCGVCRSLCVCVFVRCVRMWVCVVCVWCVCGVCLCVCVCVCVRDVLTNLTVARHISYKPKECCIDVTPSPIEIKINTHTHTHLGDKIVSSVVSDLPLSPKSAIGIVHWKVGK